MVRNNDIVYGQVMEMKDGKLEIKNKYFFYKVLSITDDKIQLIPLKKWYLTINGKIVTMPSNETKAQIITRTIKYIKPKFPICMGETENITIFLRHAIYLRSNYFYEDIEWKDIEWE